MMDPDGIHHPNPEYLSLEKIVHSFGIGINEEQAWAVVHQGICFLKGSVCDGGAGKFDGNFPNVGNTLLTQDGLVSVIDKREHGEPDGSKEEQRRQWIEGLSYAVVEACQYGLPEHEEPDLSDSLTRLLELMATENQPVDWIDPGNLSEDDSSGSSPEPPGDPKIIRKILKRTVSRCSDVDSANQHYRAVCRALFVESVDLSEFLKRVRDPEHDSLPEDARNEEFREWVKSWRQVVSQLRKGVKLRTVQSEGSDEPQVYELTPYEILMKDIVLQRFRLRTPPPSEYSKRPLDRHEMILEYIRSRPPLQPAEKRVLAPRRDSKDPVELLMESIRSFNTSLLKVTPSVPRVMDVPVVPCDNVEPKPSEPIPGPVPKRKLILPDEDLCEPMDFSQDDSKSASGHCDSRLSDFDDDLERPRANGTGVISLRLDEIALIRGALAKAELETLEDQDMALCMQIRRLEVCYSCKTTRFRWLLGATRISCHLCQNTICGSCTKTMHLPCDRLECIPVSTLSPESESEEDVESMMGRQPAFDNRPPSSYSTLPRQNLQRSQSYNNYASLTLPKAQPKKRPPLRRELTLAPSYDAQRAPAQPASLAAPRAQFRSKHPKGSTNNISIDVCLICFNVLQHAIIAEQAKLQPLYQQNGSISLTQKSKTGTLRSSSSSVMSETRSDSTEEDFEFHKNRPKVLKSVSPDFDPEPMTFTRFGFGSFLANHI